MASILIVDCDHSWCEGVGTRLRACGHLVSHAGTWSQGIGMLLRERCSLLVVAPGLPDISFYEMCLFLRRRSGRLPLVLFRLPATSASWPILRRRVRTLAGVDGTLEPSLAPAEVADLVHALACTGGDPLGSLHESELVLAASPPAHAAFLAALRAAGFRVAEARDLDGLARLLAALPYEGLVFVHQSLLGRDAEVSLRSLQAAAPGARIVVVGEGPRPPRVRDLQGIEWIAGTPQPISLLLASAREEEAGKDATMGSAAPSSRPTVAPRS